MSAPLVNHSKPKRRKLGFEPGQKLGKDLVIFAKKGEGSFGQVVGCRVLSTNSEVAVKIFHKNNGRPTCSFESTANQEKELLAAISSPFVIDYRGSFWSKCGHYCLATGYMDTTLKAKLERRKQGFPLSRLRWWAYQILNGLKAIHSAGVVHGDLKLSNILVTHSNTEDLIKICDFGSSWKINSPPDGNRIGTRYVRSPDVIIGFNYGYSIDMWSFACVMYVLFTCWEPFWIDVENGHEDENKLLLARIVGVFGPIDIPDIRCGRYFTEFFRFSGDLIQDVKKPSFGSPVRNLLKLMAFPSISKELFVFLDLLVGCFHYDCEARTTVEQALGHQFLAHIKRT